MEELVFDRKVDLGDGFKIESREFVHLKETETSDFRTSIQFGITPDHTITRWTQPPYFYLTLDHLQYCISPYTHKYLEHFLYEFDKDRIIDEIKFFSKSLKNDQFMPDSKDFTHVVNEVNYGMHLCIVVLKSDVKSLTKNFFLTAVASNIESRVLNKNCYVLINYRTAKKLTIRQILKLRDEFLDGEKREEYETILNVILKPLDNQNLKPKLKNHFKLSAFICKLFGVFKLAEKKIEKFDPTFTSDNQTCFSSEVKEMNQLTQMLEEVVADYNSLDVNNFLVPRCYKVCKKLYFLLGAIIKTQLENGEKLSFDLNKSMEDMISFFMVNLAPGKTTRRESILSDKKFQVGSVPVLKLKEVKVEKDDSRRSSVVSRRRSTRQTPKPMEVEEETDKKSDIEENENINETPIAVRRSYKPGRRGRPRRTLSQLLVDESAKMDADLEETKSEVEMEPPANFETNKVPSPTTNKVNTSAFKRRRCFSGSEEQPVAVAEKCAIPTVSQETQTMSNFGFEMSGLDELFLKRPVLKTSFGPVIYGVNCLIISSSKTVFEMDFFADFSGIEKVQLQAAGQTTTFSRFCDCNDLARLLICAIYIAINEAGVANSAMKKEDVEN
uniref:Uncharacterized protein n=1 Tax=Panagrolaimus sp. JU765 TaxID=591449 RepID=A0AC34RBU5_9BILA